MKPDTQPLHYPLGEALPPPGRTLAVGLGVHWVRMALPFVLDHINLWLLRDRVDGRDGWTIVDCGIGNEATFAAWEEVFANALEGLPVLRVVVTHMHPDHVGAADWLTRRWHSPRTDCPLWMSAAEYQAAWLASGSTPPLDGEAAATFMASHGLRDSAALDKVRARGSDYAGMVPAMPPTFRRLEDGAALTLGGTAWTCHVGHGHTAEHMALHAGAKNLLIGGDMVLPRISTNISVTEWAPEADALSLYLASLTRLQALPADTLVLPSHGRPFVGLHTRIAQLQQHHAERLAEVSAACAQAPRSAADLLPLLFRRPLDLHQMPFAMGEAIAHLHTLWHAGQLERRHDPDGVFRFSAVMPGRVDARM